MTVSNHSGYYPLNSITIKFQASKTATTTTSKKSMNQYTVYSSDSEVESEEDQYDDVSLSSVPALIKDDDERQQLMKLIVNLLSVSLAQKSFCSCCSHPIINKIFLNLLNVTKFNLQTFEKIVLLTNNYISQGQCTKYIILGLFMNSSNMEIDRWSGILNISSNALKMLVSKYKLYELLPLEVDNFNKQLKQIVKENGGSI